MKYIFLFLLAALSSLTSAAQSPVIRAHIEPTKNIMVGQPLRFTVTVLVPNYFTGSPEFPEFEIENAIVVLPQERAQNSNEQIDGVTYAGITEVYTIYPQQAGDFQLPPVEVTVPYASAPPKTTVAHVFSPVLTFHADVPAAARDLDYFLPTTRLTMQQHWSSPLKDLRAGDSIERIISVTAVKMQAMLIPPLLIEAPDGVRVYPEEPNVQDQKTDRGEFVYGRRTQSAKYFIQRAGDYTLPSIELKWWNLATNRLETATLPAVHFTAAANPNYESELPPEQELTPVVQPRHTSLWTRYKFWIRVVAPGCIVFSLVFWICWHFFPYLYHQLQAWQKLRRQSEPAYFRKLYRACKRNDAMRSYVSFLKWLAVAHPGMTIHQFLILAADPTLSAETNHLSNSLFAREINGMHWNGSTLAQLLKQHRKVQMVVINRRVGLWRLNP